MRNGVVKSLHLHPAKPGDPLIHVHELNVVAGKGIEKNGGNRMYGHNNRRQVSLIEREQLSEHSELLNRPSFLPGEVRANIETEGINLVDLVGQNIRIGEAQLFLYEPRKPCKKMDELTFGLRKNMEDGKQGVLAEIIQTGTIYKGESIIPLD